jgi:aromatic ring-opening dioxygenase catalytic subunit (LigB family)
MATESTKKAPVLFVSHGAGPFALLGADFQEGLVKLSEESRWVLDGVKGVIVVTAHWQEDQPHISSGPKPELYFDYFAEESKNLPKEAWEFKYEGAGDPELAQRIKEKFAAAGYKPVLDDKRGWDHGVWVPMILLRPQADLPVVQISIPNLGPNEIEQSLDYGRVLESFRDEGYLILGSGHSYHNYPALIAAIMPGIGEPVPIPDNRAFEDELESLSTKLVGKEREDRVRKWREFPGSVLVQPLGQEEHFLPFIVSIGASGNDSGKKLGEWDMFGAISSSFVW